MQNPAQDLMLFAKHLAMLMKSGIPLLESLQTVSEETKNKNLKKIIDSIAQDIRNGSTLAKSLAKYPRVFSPFFVGIIAVGEQSGTLDESLQYIYDSLEKSLDLRRKITNALLYPVLVVSVAILVAIGVFVFVTPQLLNLFAGLSVQLPPVTKTFISIATFLEQYGIVLIIVIVGCGVVFRFALLFAWFQRLVDSLSLRLPLFGNLLMNATLALIFRDIGIMMKSGVPITTSLTISKQMVHQKVFEQYLQDMLTAVEQGKSIASELETRKFAHIPVVTIKMIAVGEKTGKLDDTCMYIADTCEKEVDETMKNIAVIIEPVLLLVVGVFVAFVALSIISPIYELTGSIGQ